MELCSRCHKRVAVVYVTKYENGKSVTEGICLKCADELGIQPVNDILKKMGVSEESIEEVTTNLEQMAENFAAMNGLTCETDSDDEDENSQGRAPSINLGKLFADFSASKDASDGKSDKGPFGGNGPSKKNDGAGPKAKLKYLTTYCKNLTFEAVEGNLDRIVGRERELDRVIQILCRRQKNNPCLIGEPGVGKTAVAEALALRIVEGEVPYRLRDKEVYLVDLTALVAGTQFRGQFESRIQGLINEVKEEGNVILVIDEVHNIVGAGEAEGAMNAANILKPALSRGEIQVIGATTMNEYRKHIEKDSALERRFQPIIIDEPSIDEAVEIIKGIKHYYEEYHKVTISDEIAQRAVTLSERYITDRFLPDKAIDLIDEASARVSLKCTVRDELDALKERFEANEKEINRIEQQHVDEADEDARYKLLAHVKTERALMEKKLVALTAECEACPELTNDDLADVIEIWTGIPATSITENEFIRLDKLEARIKSRIIGQDVAVSAVVRAIKRSRAGVISKRKPVSFIFAGPTGVGKTELVKTIASDLFDTPDALIRVDMSEYMEQHAVSKIIGSPPGYVGFEESGQLTEKIRRHPYSVVLFDEIEKAHPDVLNILLQVLDDGKITDSHGRTVDFSNTILVMTTNAGSSVGSAKAGFGMDGGSLEENKTEKSLLEFLRPEFVNRIDEIITFRALEKEDFAKIADIMLSELRDALAEKDIKLTWTKNVSKHIAENAYSKKYGARNLRRYIQTKVEDRLASEIISNYNNKFTLAALSASGGSLKFNLA